MVPHSKPTLSSKDRMAVAQVLTSSQIAQGRKVAQFEEAFSRYLKVKDSVAVNSGTAALHAALVALGVKPGDEVIFPSYVCTALLNAVVYTGATPVIADVDPDNFNIALKDVRKKINRRTKAIIVPHMFGLPADLRPLLRLGVPVIEDCAQSIGADYAGKKAGSLGLVSIHSFYATKMMTTGEGGMASSNNTKLLERIRDLREYDKNAEFRLRFNYKMTEFQAALGLSQLRQLPQFIKRRKAIALQYHAAFVDRKAVLPQGEGHMYYRYVVKVDNAVAAIRTIRKKGVAAGSPVFKPIHLYLSRKDCPVAAELMKRNVSIPIYPSMSDETVRRVILAVRKSLNPAD